MRLYFMKGGSIYPQGNRWIYKGFNYIENGKKKRDRKSFATEEEAQHYRDCIIRDLNLKVKSFLWRYLSSHSFFRARLQ